ncbi:hypothetical protein Csa_023126 [Cucumis sativus]|nr:hypothetical protein Csa_023126 [Cucumis sativus]
MKIISSNVHGLNSWKKRALVKRSLQQQNPSIVLLQETKLDDTDSNIIKSIWSSPLIGWTTLDMIDTLGDGPGRNRMINLLQNNMWLFNQQIANYHLRDMPLKKCNLGPGRDVHQLDHVDHFPLAMTTGDIDWGPCPFKFENSWLSTPSFRPPVETWWTNNRVAGWPRHGMMMKLKALKCSFRSWNNNKHREATKLPSLISQL